MVGSRVAAALVIALMSCIAGAGQGRAQAPAKTVDLRGTLDIIRYGGNAPFDDAVAKGYFTKYGLNVSFDTAKGSQDAIARMASGVYDVGYADVSTLIDFAAGHPAQTPKAVFIVMDHSPQVIITLKKSNIRVPADLVGHTLASAETDGASKMFPAFLKANHLTTEQVRRNIVDIRLRDPMLIRGSADGIIGYDYTSVFNLKGLGVPTDELSFIYYADHGLDLYGQAVIVSQALLQRDPETVRKFVRAVSHAWVDAVADQAPAIKAVAAIDATVRTELETERLKWVIDHEVVTPNTRKHGIGYFDAARFQRNIDAVTAGLSLPKKLTITDVYDDRFQPPPEDRMLPPGK
jgi:NitT/TauT family transport system substrate-binding protein